MSASLWQDDVCVESTPLVAAAQTDLRIGQRYQVTIESSLRTYSTSIEVVVTGVYTDGSVAFTIAKSKHLIKGAPCRVQREGPGWRRVFTEVPA